MSVSDAREFSVFYEAHAKKVRGLLFRLVGESVLSDLLQESFLKAWEHRYKFRGESEASTWLYRIAYNCAVDHLRRKGRQEPVPQVEVDERLEHELTQRELVDLALSALDTEARSLVILFYLEERSLKEIAEVFAIPEGTVKSRLNSARARMNEIFLKKGVRL